MMEQYHHGQGDNIGRDKIINIFHPKTGWFENNKLWIYTLLCVAGITIAGLFFYINHLPFQVNIGIEKSKTLGIHPMYPPMGKDARLRIYLPSETKEKELTFSNDIILSDIATSLSGRICRVELLDPYWKLDRDSIQLRPGRLSIGVVPNESLANIEGRVLSRDGRQLINNAKILVEGVSGQTDTTGRFTLFIPLHLRKLNYVVRIEMAGYQVLESYYMPGSVKEFRLSK